jgi:hypothetical protein
LSALRAREGADRLLGLSEKYQLPDGLTRICRFFSISTRAPLFLGTARDLNLEVKPRFCDAIVGPPDSGDAKLGSLVWDSRSAKRRERRPSKER